jgi:MOSC domain-containing protein YiiM
MRLVYLSVGRPREVAWKGRLVTTGIFKSPVAGRVPLSRLNLEGDGQADLTVHGGLDKAVYAYPVEHYSCWRQELPGVALAGGAFGENLTTAGLDEADVRIGDRFRIGSAEVQVTQPRVPCFKLGIRLGRDDIVERFLWSGRTGFYLAVLREGELGAGDSIHRTERGPAPLTVAAVARLQRERDVGPAGRELMALAIETDALADSWRALFRRRLASAA